MFINIMSSVQQAIDILEEYHLQNEEDEKIQQQV